MRKLISILLLLIVLVATFILFNLFARTSASVHIVNTDVSNLQPRIYKKACDVFTLADAKQFIGQQTELDTKPLSNVLNSDYAQTSCTYINDQNGKKILIKLLDSTSSYSHSAFEKAEGTNPQVILGIGQKAFWTPLTNTIDVLNNQYWLSVSLIDNYKYLTFSEPKDVAALILTKL